MRYWVFTEQQLEAALGAYVRRMDREQIHVESDVAQRIRNFLGSPEARVYKLQGGASYQSGVKA